MDLLEIGRNEPCPCGSGKKYKKCCLHDVQIKKRVIAQELHDVMDLPQANLLVQALSLALGAKPDEDEVIPKTESLVTAAKSVLGNESEDYLLETHHRLEELLKSTEFRGLRFPSDLLNEAINRDDTFQEYVNSRSPRSFDQLTEIWEQLMAKVIPLLVTEGLAIDTVQALLWHLRHPDNEQADYEALIWGLWLALQKGDTGSNPLWRTLYEFTVQETAVAEEKMKEKLSQVPWNFGDVVLRRF